MVQQFIIEMFHNQLTEYKLFVNEKLISEGMCEQKVELMVPSSSASIWFYPWKIVPTVRINNFIINPGLAGMDLYEHKLDIDLTDDFYEKYHKNDISSRVESFFLNENGKNDEILFDRLIGVNDHKDVVEEIKKVLDGR